MKNRRSCFRRILNRIFAVSISFFMSRNTGSSSNLRMSLANIRLSRAKKFFGKLFNHSVLRELDAEVAVTVIPTEDALERIFHIPRLRWLRIHNTRPNPKICSDEAELLHARLEAMGAKSHDLELTKAAKVKTLKPDDDIKALANAAAVDGFVEGREKLRLEPMYLNLRSFTRRLSRLRFRVSRRLGRSYRACSAFFDSCQSYWKNRYRALCSGLLSLRLQLSRLSTRTGRALKDLYRICSASLDWCIRYWKNQYRAFHRYFAIYGGFLALLRSPYVHVALFLTVTCRLRWAQELALQILRSVSFQICSVSLWEQWQSY